MLWIIKYRVDAIALLVVSIAAAVVAGCWLRRRHQARLPKVTWALIACAVVAGIALAEVGDRAARGLLRQQIEWLPPIYAERLEKMGHAKISLDTKPDDPLYLSLIAAQVRWENINPFISDIYTMRKRPDGKMVLLVDSETDYNHNGKIDEEREERTKIGEEYDEATENMEAAFAGAAGFDDVPFSDRWGTWISAYVPMHDEQGNVEAILGVDYPADSWLAMVSWRRDFALGSAAIVAVILSASGAMLTATRHEIGRRNRVEQDLRESEGKMARLAQEDRLTGLPNRRFLQESLTDLLKTGAPQSPAEFILLFLDFDRFKIINDSLGHSTGDELLIEMAERLRQIMRTYPQSNPNCRAIAARLGGDEFVVLAHGPGVTHHAMHFAKSVREILSRSYSLAGHDVLGDTSIGLTTSEHAYRNADDVLRDADTAMYRAKAAGGARVAVFDPDMREQALERLTLEMELRDGIEDNQLILHYQPIVCLESSRLVGFESLMRWNHPRRGLMMPGDFIPLAEETGLIVPMGLWAFEQAVKHLETWQVQFPREKPLTMSVNVSRKQLALPDFASRITKILKEYNVKPNTIALEITESTVMEDIDAASRMLDTLRATGVMVYLDDFGTGYSSLSCLHRFKIDVLKVDRAFIVGAGTRRDYAAVLNSIVSLAHNLEIKLVAEGIELPEEVAVLQSMGCGFGQGYFFARPMDAAAAVEFIQRSSSLRSAA